MSLSFSQGSSQLMLEGSEGGGSGGGLSSSRRSNKGRVLRNSTAVVGRIQRSNGDRSVGCSEHSKTCCTVCSSCLQHGQIFEVKSPTT